MKKLILILMVFSLFSGCCPADKKNIKSIQFDNEFFYTDGQFNVEKAKDAVIALMEYHNYPVYEGIREQLWVSDYGTGQFTKLGLAAICPINNEQDLYMLQDLFLLPGQMLPEHWHEKPAGNLPVKMEAWFIRHGSSYVVGEGEDNMSSFPEIVVPKCHVNGTVSVKHVEYAKPGMTLKLNRETARHWQFAGKEGAIMSEVANVHSNPDVHHSDKAINDNFLGK